MVFGEFLVTVVPFLVGVLATPNTYPTAGFRRGTATQVPRDPGQPRRIGHGDCVGDVLPAIEWSIGAGFGFAGVFFIVSSWFLPTTTTPVRNSAGIPQQRADQEGVQDDGWA